MLEVLTGAGLAAAAGLNAYIPLLVMGLAARFDWIGLPSGWTWLSNEWVLVIIGLLLVVEVVADKVPAVDSVNDWIQTVVRPASGGIVFAGGISWAMGGETGRVRTESDLTPWRTARGAGGRMAPLGFPRDNRFGQVTPPPPPAPAAEEISESKD